MKKIYATFFTEGPSPYKGTMRGAYICIFDSEEELKKHITGNRYITSFKICDSREEALSLMYEFNDMVMMVTGGYGFINLYQDGSSDHIYCWLDGLKICDNRRICGRRQIIVRYRSPSCELKTCRLEDDTVLEIYADTCIIFKYEEFEKLSDEYKAIVMEIHDMYVPGGR